MSANPGYQVECRCRLRGLVGQSLHAMPRRARSRAIACLLGAVAEGVDLSSLLLAREDLRAVGVLLNQSLRYSHKQGKPDSELTARIEKVLGIVTAMVHAEETDQ